MNIIRLIRRCHLSFLLLLSAGHPLTLIACRLAPQGAQALAYFSLLLAPALLICASVPGRYRRLALCACSIALLGAGHVLLSPGIMALAMPTCCAALLAFAIAYAGRSPAQAPPMLYLFCVLAQALALFLLYQADEAVRAMAHMRGAFFLWLLLFALAFNRISLNNATLARYRLSTGMARTGTVLTLLVFLLALALCAIPTVVSGVIHLFGAMRDVGVWLLIKLLSLFPADSMGGGPAPGSPMPPALGAPTASAPSLFTLVLEKIATALSLVIIIAGSALLIRLLALALWQLMRRVIQYLQRYNAAVTEDYEDEISDTRSDSGERMFLPLRRRTRAGHAYPDTPAGRIRRRYAQLLARNPAWTDSSTARENLTPDAAALYERARYSEHTPTEQDALHFEQETQKTNKAMRKS